VLMEQFIIYLALLVSGLCLGSFAGASMWRLRARQLVQDKANGEHVCQEEYSNLEKLTKTPVSKDHSKCLHCHYRLRWYDMVPIISWLSLRGKCRKCHTPIGYLEPIIEICVAAFFVLSYAFWPYPLNSVLEITHFILWLIAGVGLAILFAYDTKWSLLPDRVSFMVIGIGAFNALLAVLGSDDKLNTLLSIAGSVFILSGLYWVIYKISQGKWIGFGDIKLGLGLALLLADWKLAFIALFAANLIGCLIVLPAMIAGKLKRNSHVPFGPLLIVGFIIAGLAGKYLVDIYFSNLLML
jgi:leader peptidase (prepilin peptidase)/N-methyltransferase